MNQDSQKQFAIKLLLISGVACAAWMFFIKPVQERVHDQILTVESHSKLIQAYNQHIGSQESGESIEVESQLSAILGAMTSTISEGDGGTSLHSLLHDSAATNGISISRIESVNAREVKQKIPDSKREIKGNNHTIRVEFEGDYDSVMLFMDEVVSTQTPVKFSSFRFIPIGHESVRVNAEIESVMLTSIPSDNAAGGMGHE